MDGHRVAVGSRRFLRDAGYRQEEVAAAALIPGRDSGEARVLVGVDGGVAGVIFVYVFQLASDPKWRFDDVLGVWPLHGLCGLWGGIACGIFGLKAFGGLGGVSFLSQLIGSLMGAAYGALAGFVIYALVDTVLGLRLTAEEEHRGADLAVHKIGANPEEDASPEHRSEEEHWYWLHLFDGETQASLAPSSAPAPAPVSAPSEAATPEPVA